MLRRLVAVGADMDDIGVTLETKGVAGFDDSYLEVLVRAGGQGRSGQ